MKMTGDIQEMEEEMEMGLNKVNENNEDKGHFKAIKVTKLEDLLNGKETILPESDLSIQTDDSIVQFDFSDVKRKQKKVEIKTGCYNIVATNTGILLQETEIKKYDLLETIDNTSQIIGEANKFFDKVSIYKELEREPKRALLLCSPPGVGKSSAIAKVSEKLLENEDTAVLIWDTSTVRSSSVNKFFLSESFYNKKVKRMIFIMEDIGGGSVDNFSGGYRGADSALLNLLDGIGSPFKGTPTFIIATTNNPETSVEALIDRPGRFDKVIEMKTPNEKESIDLLRFISKLELIDEDIEAAKLAAKEKFSIAHIQEIVVRSMIDDISMLEAAKQLVKHKKRFQQAFIESTSLGIGLKK